MAENVSRVARRSRTKRKNGRKRVTGGSPEPDGAQKRPKTCHGWLAGARRSAKTAENVSRVARWSRTKRKNGRKRVTGGSPEPDGAQKWPKMLLGWLEGGEVDQVQRVFGLGPIIGAGPGPPILAWSGLEGPYAGPGPRGESGPGPQPGLPLPRFAKNAILRATEGNAGVCHP